MESRVDIKPVCHRNVKRVLEIAEFDQERRVTSTRSAIGVTHILRWTRRLVVEKRGELVIGYWIFVIGRSESSWLFK
jgi:hypothetical protein